VQKRKEGQDRVEGDGRFGRKGREEGKEGRKERKGGSK
jgi:hypothetical protein